MQVGLSGIHGGLCGYNVPGFALRTLMVSKKLFDLDLRQAKRCSGLMTSNYSFQRAYVRASHYGSTVYICQKLQDVHHVT